jgi:hypothetical protein
MDFPKQLEVVEEHHHSPENELPDIHSVRNQTNYSSYSSSIKNESSKAAIIHNAV